MIFVSLKKNWKAAALTASIILVTACGGGSPTDGTGAGSGAQPVQSGPVSIPAGTRQFDTDILLFNGNGTWTVEVQALRALFEQKGATYDEVTSSQLSAMSADDMARYGAIVWPGGTGSTQALSLTAATRANLRKAVQELGVNYVGFCAGAFVAVAPAPAPGKDVSYGLGVLEGPLLGYYYLETAFEQSGALDVEMTEYTFADGMKRDILWYGGPVTPELPGGVVARYPNGDAAITQAWSGNGLVLIAGGHPAAPSSVKSSFGLSDMDGSDTDVAWNMIEAAFMQRPLAAF